MLDDTLSMAFLVALEMLSPDERAVLVLHDVFAYSHAEIGAMLERSEASCRQLLRRARQRLEAGRPRVAVDLAQRDELVRRFIAACEGGDLDAFLAMLTEDVVLVSDGGAKVKSARHPIRGADRVSRFLAHLVNRTTAYRSVAPTTLNGEPAVLMFDEDGGLTAALFVEPADDGRAQTMRMVRNPDKLGALR